VTAAEHSGGNQARFVASIALTVVAGLLVLTGAIALYAREEIADSESAADRAVRSLERDEVREVLARVIVADVIERSAPDLVAYRPLLESAVESALDTRAFKVAFRQAVIQAHAFVTGGGESVILDLVDAASVLRAALQSMSPDVARQVPLDESTLRQIRQRAFVADIVQATERVRFLGIVLPVIALLTLAAAVAIAPHRRSAVVRVSLAVAGAGFLLAAALSLIRVPVEGVEGTLSITDEEAGAAVEGILHAFLDDLGNWGLFLAGLGLVVSAAYASVLRTFDATSWAVRLRAFALHPPTRRARLARGVAALLLGLFAVWSPLEAVKLIVFLTAAFLLFYGTSELLALVEPRGAREAAAGVRVKRVWIGAVAAGLFLVVAAGAAAVVLAQDRGAGESLDRPDGPLTCVGSRELCDRRLNEVVLAGTHNSMAAADEPGWVIANQRYAISRQLEDGIRFFLIDAHYGVPGSEGTVRTDLEAEGTDQNRVVKALDPAAVAALGRLGTSIGLGSLEGDRAVYLCHTLCELGATNAVEALSDVRRFLEHEQGEVVVLLMESAVTEQDLEETFEQAGLLDFVATLDRSAPLPTLRELAEEGTRLLVLNEDPPSGDIAWIHDGFSFIQNTPLGPVSTSSCAESRGTRDSPLFAVNDWVDSEPPPVEANRLVQTREALLRRIRRCERDRGLPVNLIAVDHYDQGELVEVVRDLNRERASQP
jgi:hypothetical protein